MLVDSGAVRCWGYGLNGRLGHGDEHNLGDDELPGDGPVVPVGEPASTVAVGSSHSCAITDGRVRCWGLGLSGRLGYNAVNTVGDNEPASAAGVISTVAGAVRIAAGEDHTCALVNDGTVVCWGRGLDGRLGNRGTVDIGDNEAPSVTPLSLGGAVGELAVGYTHSCALLTTGEVRCWGDNQFGQLGLGHVRDIGDDELPSTSPVVALSGSARHIAAGKSHTCALLVDGTVQCWGRSDHGQLGYANTATIGDDEDPAVAGTVALGMTATAIAAGGDHSCAILADRTARCWGFGNEGGLGLGSDEDIGDDETPGSTAPIGP